MPDICDVGGADNGIAFPLFGDDEARWPTGVKVTLYFLGLSWCFMGVAILADIFMSSIERVTSKKKRVTSRKTGRIVTVQVWNDTVANLTLMALGSSAPEILLSIIGLFGNNFYSEDLGPSTIVGSAAFNLFVIIAVCIVGLPAGETRSIEDTTVFAITASFSILAYVWLVVILLLSSADVVDIWEGILTFLFFPLLVFVAYLADIGTFGRKRKTTSSIVWSELSEQDFHKMERSIREKHGENISEEAVHTLMEIEYSPSPSRAVYRVAAIRNMSGGKRVKYCKPFGCQQITVFGKHDNGEVADVPVVDFSARRYTVVESADIVQLMVVRSGLTAATLDVSYDTREGSAKEGEDFKRVTGQLHFGEGETEKVIEVPIVNDERHEDTESFFVDLRSPCCHAQNLIPQLGATATAEVFIVDDDSAGVIAFEKEHISVTTPTIQTTLQLRVRRHKGASGEVTVNYNTEDGKAKAGLAYESVAGQLTFAAGEEEAVVEVKINPTHQHDITQDFRLYLKDPIGGATLDSTTDGGADANICTIFIKGDLEVKERSERIRQIMASRWDSAQIGDQKWLDQFKEALYPGGSSEDMQHARVVDWILHVCCFPWKILFAFVPPPDFCGGWVCFVCALIMIAFVTTAIGDLANLLGCSMGISPSITAITFVALGTSLPDTFASKTAAINDPNADASIGNVTGSNSVNVFLGLGLPWSIGAIYWTCNGSTAKWLETFPDLSADYPDGAFVVEAGALAPSVATFCALALVAILFLEWRRVKTGAELGGNVVVARLSALFLVFLWFVYIGVSIYLDATQ